MRAVSALQEKDFVFGEGIALREGVKKLHQAHREAVESSSISRLSSHLKVVPS